MAETTIEQAPKDESVLQEANNLLVQGKRLMALEDFQSATDLLEQAVQLYDAYYGVAKIQCADAYLEYGQALVALANVEAGSGTDGLMKKAGIDVEKDGDDDDDDDDEDGEEEEEEEEDGDHKMDEEEEEKITNGKSSETNGKTAEGEDKIDEGAKRIPSEQQPQSTTSQTEPMPGTSSGVVSTSGDDEEVENEEATTIEIAWEVLCLAKRLFMTDESTEGRLKLAETLQKLGEISIEWENNDNAVSILEECLNIRKAILPEDDRLIAVTYYQLGLAHSFKSEIQNANENFQNAINVIEKRISSLSKDIELAKTAQDTVAISTHEREINELRELLPDITMRMDDSKEDVSSSSEAIKRTREEMQLEEEEVKKVCLDKTKPVDDISHLVKRKAA